jgi:hypothetical protein
VSWIASASKAGSFTIMNTCKNTIYDPEDVKQKEARHPEQVIWRRGNVPRHIMRYPPAIWEYHHPQCDAMGTGLVEEQIRYNKCNGP